MTASPKKVVDVTSLFQDDQTAYTRGAIQTTGHKDSFNLSFKSTEAGYRASDIGISPLRTKGHKFSSDKYTIVSRSNIS